MSEANRLNALIVDDNAYARAAAAATLRRLGLNRIVGADGGAAAVGHLLGEPFDLMLMDWYMPEMGGAALLDIVRDSRFGPRGSLPIVLMTAYPSHETIARARHLGVNEVLVKPLTAGQVSLTLNRVLPAGWQASDGGDDSASKVFL